MPFRSEKQRRFLWSQHPDIARRWTQEYGSKPVARPPLRAVGRKLGSSQKSAGSRHSAAHPGFQAVQARIASKQGISKDRAGAILAASSRGASKAAKRKNPRLKRV